MEIKLNLKFIKLKDHFNPFFVAKFPVIRKIEVVPKEVFSHDIGFSCSCERTLTYSGSTNLYKKNVLLDCGMSILKISSYLQECISRTQLKIREDSRQKSGRDGRDDGRFCRDSAEIHGRDRPFLEDFCEIIQPRSRPNL